MKFINKSSIDETIGLFRKLSTIRVKNVSIKIYIVILYYIILYYKIELL